MSSDAHIRSLIQSSVDSMNQALINSDISITVRLVHTQSVTNKFAFRLPSGYRATKFYVTVEGTSPVRSVEVASSMGELSQ